MKKLAFTVATLLLYGCGSEPTLGMTLDTSKSGGPGASAALTNGDYPPPPYGTARLSVIPNFHFYGWRDPKGSNYDLNKLELISMADYYDPDGSKGSKALLINVSGLWCGVCQAEHQGGTYQLASGGTATWKPIVDEVTSRESRGLRYLETVVDGPDERYIATPDELVQWVKTYSMSIPVVLDPEYQMAALRQDDGGWPTNFVVKTNDMTIVYGIQTADPDTLWAFVERLLDQ